MKKVLLSLAVVMLVGTGIEVKAMKSLRKPVAPAQTAVGVQPKPPVEQKKTPAVQAKQQAVTTQLPNEDTIKVYIIEMAQSKGNDARQYVQNLGRFVSDLATAHLAQAKKNEELTAEYNKAKNRAEERITLAEAGPGVMVEPMIEELQQILGKLESFYNEIKDTYMGPIVDSQIKEIRNAIGKLEVHKPISKGPEKGN